jgi:glycosyltransferase involved in cell wall biosynthesis
MCGIKRNMVAVPLLFVDHAPALGGAERSLLMLLQRLDRSRFAPHLACISGSLAETVQAAGISVHRLDLPRLRRSPRALLTWVSTARSLAVCAREVQARAVVANTVRAAFYAAPAARFACIPFVWHMRDFWLSETQPRHLWADAFLKHALCAAATAVIANSYATAAQLPCSRKITVVHNGIEIDRFDPANDGSTFRRDHGIPLDIPVVGTMGRLRPWKGQDRLLRAMAHVHEQVHTVHTVVIGGSPFGEVDDYVPQLHYLAQDLALPVTFTGQLNDPCPAIAAIDIFVHPGDPEPFGLVNVEAMAMGKPVVAFAHGALPEIVVEDETGLLIRPYDEAVMAEAIIALLHDPVRRTAMGQAGRTRVETHFTIARTVREVENVLETVL